MVYDDWLAGMRVFVHGCAATPLTLLSALAKHGVDAKLKDVELIHIHTEGPGVCVQPEYNGAVCYFLFYDVAVPFVAMFSSSHAYINKC